MKAIAVTEIGMLSVVEDVPLPELSDGQVLVRMLAGGVCGSDLAKLDREIGRAGALRVIGHEGGGIVTEVGNGVESLRSGDLVVVEPNYVCFTCEWCRRGMSKGCVRRTVVGRDVPGLFSEFVSVPEPFAWKLPPDTSPEVFATFEAATVARVAIDRMSIHDMDRVLVVGAGSQGASAVNIMVDRGIKPAVTDPHDARLQRAVDIGAYDALAAPDSLFDVVFETSGTAKGLETALLRSEKFGRVALIGQTHGAVPVSTRPIVQKELTVQGSVIYNHPGDFSQSLSELQIGRFEPAVGLREPVGPHQAVEDLGRARTFDGKMWISFTDWMQ